MVFVADRILNHPNTCPCVIISPWDRVEPMNTMEITFVIVILYGKRDFIDVIKIPDPFNLWQGDGPDLIIWILQNLHLEGRRGKSKIQSKVGFLWFCWWRGPDGKDLRVSFKSTEQPLADSQQENWDSFLQL